VTPDDGHVWPKHVVEREEDNKWITLWTEVQCMNEEYGNATGCLNTIFKRETMIYIYIYIYRCIYIVFQNYII
jgi:hypothetical protein